MLSWPGGGGRGTELVTGTFTVTITLSLFELTSWMMDDATFFTFHTVVVHDRECKGEVSYA